MTDPSSCEGPVTVYYNSACPVCNAGIESQRRRMGDDAAQTEWIDIHSHPEALEPIGAEREFVRKKLHVVDASGAVHIGMRAFSVLWLRTPDQRWLGRLIELPIVRTLARWAYDAFAALLYRWNRACGRW